MNERQLVEEYKKAKDALEELTEAKSKAQIAFDKIQNDLVEYLEAKGATATAKYDGIGRVSLTKPTLYANVLAENRDILYSWLESIGRGDLVKPSVHPKTLSSFVKEETDNGKPMPDFITVSYKSIVRFNQ